jgi:hypothetical protein
MDIDLDQFGRECRIGRPADCGTAARLDWPGLAARLAAAHAARHILRGEAIVAAPVSGSFAPAVARLLAPDPAAAHRRPPAFRHAALTQYLKPMANPHAG